jgi:hypothetical protein
MIDRLTIKFSMIFLVELEDILETKFSDIISNSINSTNLGLARYTSTCSLKIGLNSFSVVKHDI